MSLRRLIGKARELSEELRKLQGRNMKELRTTLLTTGLAAIVFATGVLAQQSKEPTGAAALQGTWQVTSINGESAPDGTPPLTLTFTGDKYQQALGGEVNERGTMKIDGSKKPMTIDL